MTILIVTTWRTDDLCPACGNAPTATDDGHPRITFTCACGWSDTWTGGHGSEADR